MKNETQHTPGRIQITRPVTPDGTKLGIAGEWQPNKGHGQTAISIATVENHLRPEGQANAARLVACWNACLEMDDPEKEIDRLRQQRGSYLAATTKLRAEKVELVNALQALLDSEDTTLGDGGSILGDDLRTMARNLIARYK